MKDVKLGALLLSGLCSNEYKPGLDSGVKLGEDGTELPAPRGFSWGDPFCLDRFICKH